MRLSELKTGERGVIVKVLGHGGFRKRIVEMGFIKGKAVDVVLNAPLRDPIKYRVMGYDISLRRQEAAMIEVAELTGQWATVGDGQPQPEQGATAASGALSCATAQPSGSGQADSATLSSAGQGPVPMDDDTLRQIAAERRRTVNVAFVGNPNCGKTSLFNIASGSHEKVGNYSGVTVDAKEGHFDFQGYHFRIIDLPGTYSLSAYSPEELYVRRHIIDQMPDAIINVIDSSNLERNLYLTTQLIDMNVRMVCALNMYDELEQSGNTLDYEALGTLLGVPMVPTVARTGQGIEELFQTVIDVYEGEATQVRPAGGASGKGDKPSPTASHARPLARSARPLARHIHINHGPELERSIEAVRAEIVRDPDVRAKYSTRFLSIKLLENDKTVEQVIAALPSGADILAARQREQERIRQTLGEESEQAITDAKYGFISGALRETYQDRHLDRNKLTRVIDLFVTNRYLGYPIFFLLLYIMFQCTFSIGQYPMDWIEAGVGALGELIEANMAEGPFKALLIDGVIGGVGGVIVFLPNILILYFFISLLEDSGYMARAAFIMDKIMHKMGLHGKSFIPLIMGFGCNVPAIMATRMIENRKCRLITMLIAPFMSCSARLPIYLLLVGAFFPRHASLVLLSIYAIGILLSVVFARIFSRFLVRGDDTPFVMELPPYRLPTAKAILRHTWEKGVQYLKKMGGIILVASLIVWALGYYPHHDAYDTQVEQQENSYIGRLGKAIEPVIHPLGFDWKLGIGILTGVGAKELVVSTLGVLYADDAEIEAESLGHRIPITPLVAFGYMLFVLVYFPCIATLAAIKGETGSWRWGLFSAVYTTVLAWLLAFAVFQVGSLLGG